MFFFNHFLYHGDRTISKIWESAGGERSTSGMAICSASVNSGLRNGAFRNPCKQGPLKHADLCACSTVVGGGGGGQVQTASTDLWPQEMFTFSETHANGQRESEARGWTCQKVVPVPYRNPESECMCHERPVGLQAHYVLLVSSASLVWKIELFPRTSAIELSKSVTFRFLLSFKSTLKPIQFHQRQD